MEGGEQEESSAKRRERLLALRSSAAAASSPSAAPPPPPPEAAAWDLPELDLVDAAAPRPPSRFDYYTNPAAAFASSASHKRKVADSPAPAPPYGSGNYGSGYPPPHQHHVAPSPIHSPPQMAHDSPMSSPWRTPVHFQPPMSGYGGPPPGAPPPWSQHSACPSQGHYPHSPSFAYKSSNPGQGGGRMNKQNYGRGRGQNYYGSPGSRGQGGMGGFSFQSYSGCQDGRNIYNKSMIDDPWRDLQPIVGNILIPRDKSKSWLPESLRAKKDTSYRGQIKPTSEGLSLAEYLDLSFNEASNDT
ncbi:hypothetical protein E2562_028343 [Oryza meyeriana var. granulata]|uniref:Uncharacterized protein n=1 Tax=Oryza meyeriana var. granulata TaxID=110450 RepID=A0A6G1FCY5_9ORYZ|nr:hypothetical protein E2562_028343 [Oryza meyeriana var. granulata]